MKERKKLWEQKISYSTSQIGVLASISQPKDSLNDTKQTNNTSSTHETVSKLSKKWSSMVSIDNNSNNNNSRMSKNNEIIINKKNIIDTSNSSTTKNPNLNKNLSMNEIDKIGCVERIASVESRDINKVKSTAADDDNNNNKYNQTNIKSAKTEIIKLEQSDLIEQDERYDSISPQIKSNSCSANMVKKLKQKFDHKDQSFIKVKLTEQSKVS